MHNTKLCHKLTINIKRFEIFLHVYNERDIINQKNYLSDKKWYFFC